MTSLSKVIAVDETKCVNCHACISACPVKYCNDSSGDIVTVNSDMCIACGKCITACTHDARSFIDDFFKFIDGIIAGEKIIAISASAVAAGFPEQYLNLNSWLKELGVDAIFDVSFGAELTTKSYVEYIQNENPQTVISQHCAAIVTYIELYQPELIKYLAPTDSPMLHTIKMVHEFYPQYKNHKIAIISPCVAKKREFEETGFGDYNIAHISIDNFLKKNNVNLKDYPQTNFDNPPAERAVLFSSPGGLLETAKRWIPEIENNSRKIEGTPLIYEYLKTLPKMIDKSMSPLLIDCLSCEFGCNSGPLTVTKDKPQDEIEYWVRKRSNDLKKKYLDENENNEKLSTRKIEQVINKYWKDKLYERTYVNRWENVKLSYPTKTELKNIYATMHKYTDDDIKNCTACGYNTCEGMAIAIKNGLNKPENCHYYIKKEGEVAIEESKKSKQKFVTILDTAIDGFIELNLDEIIIDANPAMKKILKKSDIVGRKLYDFIDDKNIEILKNQIANRKKGDTASYELEFTQSEGEKIFCLVSATPKYDFNTQKITGSFAMVSDISKIKKAEKELKKSHENLEERIKERTLKLSEAFEEIQQRNEEMHQQQEEILAQRDSLEDSEKRTKYILSSIPDAVFIINKNKEIVFWNNSMENLTGIKAEQMLGKGNYEYAIPFYGERKPILIDLVNLDDNYLKENYSSIKKNGNILQAETYVPSMNGKKSYLVGIATAIYDKNNNYDGAIEVIHNITERKKHQKEIERLSIVASETDNAIILMDKNGDFEWVNKAFTETYGLDLEKLIKIKGRNILGATNYKDIENLLKETINTKKSNTYVSKEQNKNREEIYTQTTLTPILNNKNEIKNIVAINTDVTEQKQIEEKLSEAFEEIQQRNEEMHQQQEEILAQRDALELSEEHTKKQNKELETKQVELNEKIEELNITTKVLEDFTGELEQQQLEILEKNEELETQKQLAVKQNKSITDSIEYAKRIQIAILKTEKLLDITDIFVLFQPKDIVSGDFYLIKKLFNYSIIIAADSTGHGVPGAFMSLLGVSLLNEIIAKNYRKIRRTGFSASKILDDLRKNIINILQQKNEKIHNKDGMDIAICIIDNDLQQLQYAGAYNSLIFIRNNKLTEIKADKMPVGIHTLIHNPKNFTNNTIELEKNDTFYIFSDGYQDQFGGKKGRKFMIRKLKELLLEINEKSMTEQKKILRQRLEEHKGNIPQTDDIILIGFRY